MIILGLDASTTSVGFTTFNTHTDKASRCWETSYAGELVFRMESIERELRETIHLFQPGVLAVELPVLVKNRYEAYRRQCEVIGICRLAAHKNGVARFMEINPSSVKSALSHGRATKKEMIAAAKLVLERVSIKEHQADSLGVALAAWSQIKYEVLEREVL